MKSDTSSDGAPPQRGRPRSEPARRAIIAAAGQLLLGRGLDEVSMDAVADHAEVSKATIYRWWRTKESLALDALFHEWQLAVPATRDTGSLRGDLLAYLRPWVRRARRRAFARVIASLINAAHRDTSFAAEYRERFVEVRREPARIVFSRAIERGEIPATDVDFALDLIFGPVYHRLLHQHAPLNDRFLEDVVDVVLAGLARPSHPTIRRSPGPALPRRAAKDR